MVPCCYALRTLRAKEMPQKTLHQVMFSLDGNQSVDVWLTGLVGGTQANETLTAWTTSSDGPSGEDFFQMKHPPSEKWRHRLTE